MDEWLHKVCYSHTKEYYSGLRRKEILTHVTVGMKLEDTVQSEIIQSEKDKHCMIPLIWDT